MKEKVQLTDNAMNSIENGAVLYEKDTKVDSIALLIKGRVEMVADGVSLVLGTGNFLGVCDIGKETHSFTYMAKDDSAVFVIPVQGMDSIEHILTEKPDYRGLLVTSLNYFLAEMKKQLQHLREENQSLCDFLKEKYELCNRVASICGFDLSVENALKKLDNSIQALEEPEDLSRYYLECARMPIEVQKKFFSSSQFVALYHFREQCDLVGEFLTYCRNQAEVLYKLFRCLILEEDALFQTVGKLALSLLEKGMRDPGIDQSVDQIVEKINDTETFLAERAGISIQLDRDKMERLYFALLSGEGQAQEEKERMDEPGIEYLYESLEQIVEYAPVHMRVKSEFTEAVEAFMTLSDKFARTPEATEVRKSVSRLFYEIYEAVVKKSMDDEELPLAVRLFLDYGFVSEKLLSDEELNTLLRLRPEADTAEDGCRVYTMARWLRAVYDGVKETSKNEFDEDFADYLRRQVKEKKMTQQAMDAALADQEQRLHFECQNMFRYASRAINGNISLFVPVLCSDGMYSNMKNSYITEKRLNDAIRQIEKIDYSVFYRERLVSYEKLDVNKAMIIERVTPDIIVFPIYGRNTIMWQDITGKRHNSKGRLFVPVWLEKELNLEMVHLLGDFRWEKCRTETGGHWNDFRYPSLTSEYTDYLQFYKKNSELSQERKNKVRAQLVQCNNKHKEVFLKDYADWILREARGAMKLNRVSRQILFTYCPFSTKTMKALEGQTPYSEAAKKYIRDNRAARKSLEMVMHKWTKAGLDVPQEIRATAEFLKG
ncbi:MAG: hypothetical protein ACI4SQ_04280 [Eubacterium sp.]